MTIVSIALVTSTVGSNNFGKVGEVLSNKSGKKPLNHPLKIDKSKPTL